MSTAKRITLGLTIFLGFCLLLKPTITGNAVAIPDTINVGAAQLVGIAAILISTILLATASLEKKVEYNKEALESTREFLEKEHHTHLSEADARRVLEGFPKYEKKMREGVRRYEKTHDDPFKNANINEVVNEATNEYLILLGTEKGKDANPSGFIKAYLSEKFSGAEKNEAQLALDDNKIYDKRRELIGLAKRCNYVIEDNNKEGTKIYKKGSKTPITVIPKSSNINKGTAKWIIKALATGE